MRSDLFTTKHNESLVEILNSFFVIKAIKRLLISNQRTSPRWVAKSGIECLVSQMPVGESHFVKVRNISSSGCSILIKTCHFDFDKKTSLIFQAEGLNPIVTSGRVVSQSVFYPSGSELLRDAVYRFSIAFDGQLSAKEIDILKIETKTLSN